MDRTVYRGKLSSVVSRVVSLGLLTVAAAFGAGDEPAGNRSPSVKYVGSRVCAGCHAQIYRDYLKTAMGRSMDDAGSERHRASVPSSASVAAGNSNHRFEVSTSGGSLVQSDFALDAGAREIFRESHKLDYVIGSGMNGYTYLVRRGDHFFEAPLSYYTRKQAWDLSPGYEHLDAGFSRPVAAACIACHSGRPNTVKDREGLFGNPPFHELSIGCENCHGPGELHVAAHGKGLSARTAAGTIVNPAKLNPRLAEDICMNCHQGGDTRVLAPGKDYFDFRPGTPLRDTLAVLRVPLKKGAAGDSDLLEHHFSMQLSKCYLASEGRLSCLTCHKIHAMPKPQEAAGYYRGRCLTCHTPKSCKLPQEARARRNDDCVSCHMPKRDVGVISHSALTNHRIPARPGEPLPAIAYEQTTEDLPDLVYLNRPPGAQKANLPAVTLLQAYGELLGKYPSYAERYNEVLDQLSRQPAPGKLVEAALGRRALGEDASGETAMAHLSRAIELGFLAPATFADLAEAQARAGRDTAAIETLQKGIEISPYSQLLQKSLVLRYIRLKRYDEAAKTLERYVELFPEDDFMRSLLLKGKGLAGPSNR
jgi:hypothetical protein